MRMRGDTSKLGWEWGETSKLGWEWEEKQANYDENERRNK